MNLQLIFISILLFALSISANADEERLEKYRGDRITDVVIEGDGIPPLARERILSLKRRNFSPTDIRTLLVWMNESGVDHAVHIGVRPDRGGVIIVLRSKQKTKIKEIIFEGNAVVGSNQLLPLTQMAEGFEFEREVADEAIKKIGLNYSRMGYLASDVSYFFDESSGKVTFKIVEGEPTLLANLEISPLKTVERKDLRDRYESEIREAFGLKLGDRIEREKVLDGIQAIKDWLREHDFLLAKDPVLDYHVQENGTVALSINIQYGTRIRYG